MMPRPVLFSGCPGWEYQGLFMRLDAYLVERGHFPSRARAQAAIKAGLVRIDGAVAQRPAATVSAGAAVAVQGDVHPFVSRGGLKLEAALTSFGVQLEGAVCLDLGASTGGFTDVLLRGGALRVYAVDVGTGQLHTSLAANPRVINLEKTHARDLSSSLVPERIDLLACDLSFISLTKALLPALALCRAGATLVALIKPQFEMGRENIGKGGIVDAAPEDIALMIERLTGWIEGQGWRALKVIDSPILGGDGNREYLLGATKNA